MKFIKYLIFFIILQGCSSNYEWGWYILSPNNIDGLTNLKLTYNNDLQTKTNIDLEIKRLQTRIDRLDNVLVISI